MTDALITGLFAIGGAAIGVLGSRISMGKEYNLKKIDSKAEELTNQLKSFRHLEDLYAKKLATEKESWQTVRNKNRKKIVDEDGYERPYYSERQADLALKSIRYNSSRLFTFSLNPTQKLLLAIYLIWILCNSIVLFVWGDYHHFNIGQYPWPFDAPYDWFDYALCLLFPLFVYIEYLLFKGFAKRNVNSKKDLNNKTKKEESEA